MKRALFLSIALALFAGVGSAGADTVKGFAEDPNFPVLGSVKYLGTPQGYHFWFTPTQDIGLHDAGHSYHGVYRFDVEDSSDWCGPTTVPNRAPYNLVAAPGQLAWYKTFDTTTGEVVCGLD